MACLAIILLFEQFNMGVWGLLALLLQSPPAGALAGLAWVAGTGLRALRTRAWSRDLVQGLVPLAVGAALPDPWWAGAAGASLAYLALAWSGWGVPGSPAHVLGGWALGLTLRLAPQATPLVLLAAFYAWRLDKLERERTPFERSELLERRADRYQQAVQQKASALQRARSELHEKTDELAMLGELSRALAQARTPNQCLDLLLDATARLVGGENLVVFMLEDGLLRAARWRSRHGERLENAELIGGSWTLAEQAVRQHTIQRGAPLFPEDRCGWALPLEGGALYVGTESLAAERLLALILEQVSLALRTARLLEEQEQSLQATTRQQKFLQSWLESLDVLLDGARSLTGTLEPETLLERLGGVVARLASPDRAALAWSDGVRALLGSFPTSELMTELVDVTQRYGRPLLVEDLRASRFQGIAGDDLSLLAVALPSGLGVLVLTAARPNAFTRGHVQLIEVLAYQGGLAFRNAELYDQTVRTLAELKHSQARLVESSKLAAVGQLAAGVAHELNTPLCSVSLTMESAALQLKDSPRLQDKVKVALGQLERARQIVEKLLVYSREGGDGRAPVELNGLVEDVLLLLSAPLEGVEVVRELQPIPRVEGNSRQFQQVLQALFQNALDQEARRLTIRTYAQEGCVCLLVEDDGPGVPPEIRDRIFEPFFTTGPIGKSTGLGLAMGREVIASFGGCLEHREGSTFQITLPALPA